MTPTLRESEREALAQLYFNLIEIVLRRYCRNEASLECENGDPLTLDRRSQFSEMRKAD